jgi:hypothetical protein
MVRCRWAAVYDDEGPEGGLHHKDDGDENQEVRAAAAHWLKHAHGPLRDFDPDSKRSHQRPAEQYQRHADAIPRRRPAIAGAAVVTAPDGDSGCLEDQPQSNSQPQ